jgi:hypothetical protein
MPTVAEANAFSLGGYMVKIGVSFHDLILPGVTVWRDGSVEVVRYRVYAPLDVKDENGDNRHVDGFVFGVLEHVEPGLAPAVGGYYTEEDDAIAEAKAGLQ